MFRKKSDREELRAGEGVSAPALIVSTKMGRDSWGARGQSGLTSKHQIVYGLKVQPAGEAPFDAEAKVWADAWKETSEPIEGWTLTVLYDPNDHSKVTIDVEASGPGLQSQFEAQMRRERSEEQEFFEGGPGGS